MRIYLSFPPRRTSCSWPFFHPGAQFLHDEKADAYFIDFIGQANVVTMEKPLPREAERAKTEPVKKVLKTIREND